MLVADPLTNIIVVPVALPGLGYCTCVCDDYAGFTHQVLQATIVPPHHRQKVISLGVKTSVINSNDIVCARVCVCVLVLVPPCVCRRKKVRVIAIGHKQLL